jgi:hypothetical protein
MTDVRRGITEHLARLYPGWRVVAFEPLAADSGAGDESTEKAIGYGLPMKIRLADKHGGERAIVWRVSSANEFGHDRRADRAGNTILAFDDFQTIPRHITALDVGGITKSGELVSLRDCGELYLITSFAPGTIYADDLRRIAHDGIATDLDLARASALAKYLAALHVPLEGKHRYRRAIRDLVGHGEGIFGIVDGYPPGALVGRLRAIEERCVAWRWRLRAHEDRLARTHGDFHPFNIVFDHDTDLACLDASRGTCGDPADDVCALAVNYILFAIDRPASWMPGLGALWHRFWHVYAQAASDEELLHVAPPFFAWRALVVCNPKFYPSLSDEHRFELLDFAIGVLDAGVLDPRVADRLFL